MAAGGGACPHGPVPEAHPAASGALDCPGVGEARPVGAGVLDRAADAAGYIFERGFAVVVEHCSQEAFVHRREPIPDGSRDLFDHGPFSLRDRCLNRGGRDRAGKVATEAPGMEPDQLGSCTDSPAWPQRIGRGPRHGLRAAGELTRRPARTDCHHSAQSWHRSEVFLTLRDSSPVFSSRIGGRAVVVGWSW